MSRLAGMRLRPALLWVHRWLGLTVGLLFTAIALSGSLLLFQPQFFEWAHGRMIPDQLPAEPGSVDAWLASARAAVPGLGEPIAIWRPHVSHNVSDAGMLVFAGREPAGFGNTGFVAALVAPASGELLGVVHIDHSPAYAPLFFHRDFWAGGAGRLVSGLMALATLAALLIGLYLWWPAWARLLRKLSPRPWRKLANVSLLHDWLGIWSLAVLLVLTVTGLYLVQPTWVEPALEVLPDGDDTAVASSDVCRRPIGFDTALAAAQELVPGGTWTAIYPGDRSAVWEIALKRDGDTDPDHGDSWVYADLGCGTVALHETAATRPPRHSAEVWLTGLHDGSVFGGAGEAAVALFGLAPVVLYVTGFIAWWRRRWPREAVRSASLATRGAGEKRVRSSRLFRRSS